MHSNAEPFSYRADRSESRHDLQMLFVEHFPLYHLLAKLQTQYVGPKLAASHGTLGQRTAGDVGKTNSGSGVAAIESRSLSAELSNLHWRSPSDG